MVVTWVVSAADDRDAWDRCEGRVRMDLRGEESRVVLESQKHLNGSLGFRFGAVEGCDDFFSADVSVTGDDAHDPDLIPVWHAFSGRRL